MFIKLFVKGSEIRGKVHRLDWHFSLTDRYWQPYRFAVFVLGAVSSRGGWQGQSWQPQIGYAFQNASPSLHSN